MARTFEADDYVGTGWGREYRIALGLVGEASDENPGRHMIRLLDARVLPALAGAAVPHQVREAAALREFLDLSTVVAFREVEYPQARRVLADGCILSGIAAFIDLHAGDASEHARVYAAFMARAFPGCAASRREKRTD